MTTSFDNDQIMDAFAEEKLAEGRAEGRAEGQAEGKWSKAVEAARNLLREGLSAELISRVVDLPLSEVDTLKQQL